MMPDARRLIFTLILGLLAFSMGCNETVTDYDSLLSDLPVMAAARCPDIRLPEGAIRLKKGSVVIDRKWYCYYLLKLAYEGKDPSYAMWIPPVDGGVRPAVLVTCPYDYISWNGDEVPRGAEMSVKQYVAGAALYALNNFGVLYVFERFYAGGSIQNDVDDTVAGYRFLNESEGLVDKARIGTWGGSWGGFEALYGAAYSSDGGGMAPAAGVAFFPVSDFGGTDGEHAYVSIAAGGVPNNIPDIADETKRTQYQDFFAPYIERIEATVGWETWTGQKLLDNLETPFVVVHDEWDALVPFEQSVYLVNNDVPEGLITPIFFYQDTPRDLDDLIYGWGHGELREFALDETPPPAEGVIYGMANTLASAFLLTRLATPDQDRIIIGYDGAALADFMEYARDITGAPSSRDDMAWAARLLRDCTDNRILMINLADSSVATGAEVIAGAFSAAGWGGTSYGTAASVRTALEGGLPL